MVMVMVLTVKVLKTTEHFKKVKTKTKQSILYLNINVKSENFIIQPIFKQHIPDPQALPCCHGDP